MQKAPLRPFQAQAIEILRKNSTVHLICISQTGSGKSRIFEELASSQSSNGRPPFTVVVAPLQALVRQHESQLNSLGVFTSRQSQHERLSNRPQAIVTTPERLSLLLKRGLRLPSDSLFVVDECHCVESWGDHFRPEFSKLPDIVRDYSIRRSLWLSATLPLKSRERLLQALPKPTVETGDFSLNPSIRVTKVRTPWQNRIPFLLNKIKHDRSPGVVFSSTREQCTQLARLLSSLSSKAEEVASYHAGMSREERITVEKKLRSQEIRWVSATSAFGMGMDFTHLNWVILWQVPYSVLDLTQMIGRVGRAAQAQASAFLLWDYSDFFWLKNRLPADEWNSLKRIYLTEGSFYSSITKHFGANNLTHEPNRPLIF